MSPANLDELGYYIAHPSYNSVVIRNVAPWKKVILRVVIMMVCLQLAEFLGDLYLGVRRADTELIRQRVLIPLAMIAIFCLPYTLFHLWRQRTRLK